MLLPEEKNTPSFKQRYKTFFGNLPERLLNPDDFAKIVSIGTYTILTAVSLIMTIMNVITHKGFLTLSTAIFAVLCLFNIALALSGKKGVTISRTIFAFELLSLFTFFLVSGNPDGFSACWISLVPSVGLTFYGRKAGSAFCSAMLAITVFLFWTPIGHTRLMYNYNPTFMARFPLLYCAFFALAFLLESIRLFYNVQLLKLNDAQKEVSIRDQLTGSLNRVGLFEALRNRSLSNPYRKIGVVIMDLDFFKKVNDTYGHSAGDYVLQEFSKMLQKYMKAVVCRWGGEEFSLVYFDEDVHHYDLDFLRRELENRIFVYERHEIKITVSMGVFETSSQNLSDFNLWMKNADSALYRAKSNGRNQVIYY